MITMIIQKELEKGFNIQDRKELIRR